MKHFVILLLASLTLFSCSKEKSIETGAAVPGTPGGGNTGGGNTGGGNTGGGGTYFIQARVDGAERTYTTNAAAITSTTMGITSYSLTAGTTTGEAVSLSLTFLSGAPAANTTYTENGNPGAYVLTGMLVNTSSEAWLAGMTPNTADALSVTLTSKTATEMAGTFKGAFYKLNADGSTSATEHKRFTEGQFKLPIR